MKLAEAEAALWEHEIMQGVSSEPEEESIRNWEIIMEYKISNLDFTMKSEDDFYDTVDMSDFRDADADLIYEHLHKKMRIIPFCDYLKRYIFKKAEFEGSINDISILYGIYHIYLRAIYSRHICRLSVNKLTV